MRTSIIAPIKVKTSSHAIKAPLYANEYIYGLPNTSKVLKKILPDTKWHKNLPDKDSVTPNIMPISFLFLKSPERQRKVKAKI